MKALFKGRDFDIEITEYVRGPHVFVDVRDKRGQMLLGMKFQQNYSPTVLEGDDVILNYRRGTSFEFHQFVDKVKDEEIIKAIIEQHFAEKPEGSNPT